MKCRRRFFISPARAVFVKPRGGAAPQKEGVEGGKLLPVESGFGVQGREEGLNVVNRGYGVKIAIGAFSLAERDVDVKAGIF